VTSRCAAGATASLELVFEDARKPPGASALTGPTPGPINTQWTP